MVAARLCTGLLVGLLVGCPSSGARATPSPAPPAPPVADSQLPERLRAHTTRLAAAIGPRHAGGALSGLDDAAGYVLSTWLKFGLDVREQAYALSSGELVTNVIAEIPGSDPSLPLVVLGAHYDSVATGTPGADDNASGVAVLLEVSRALAEWKPRRPIRLVAFTCEEPPYFQTADMGSLRYARGLEQAGVPVHAMFALDCVGYFADGEDTQRYLPGTGPHPTTQGNFLAVVGNEASRELVERVATAWSAPLPVQKQVFPDAVPEAGWSDHWSFWQIGAPAIVLSDSGPFRNSHYHERSDTPDTLDYPRMAQVTTGLVDALRNETR